MWFYEPYLAPMGPLSTFCSSLRIKQALLIIVPLNELCSDRLPYIVPHF